MGEKMGTSNSLRNNQIILRNFPKAIFFTPLFLVSVTFCIAQSFLTDFNPWFGLIWVVIFFSNFTVTALDFPSYRVLILILGVVIVVLLAIFLGLIPTLKQLGIVGQNFRIGLSAEFYMIMAIILGLILGLVIVSSRFDYYRIERNEVIHKTGFFSTSLERFPVRGLRIKKEIPDLFEYLLFKAGTITLMFPKDNKIVHLNTVLNVKKKAERIDLLLSSLQII
ncbi:MAG: hypothetical protein ACFE9V_07040 [Candidatus Hodarchaeota archaeon]